MSRLRLASVPYVNAAPLTRGFLRGPLRDHYDMTFHTPARLADLLRTGGAEAALLPAIEYQNLEGAEILPFLCIASKRRARSVYLASRVPLESIRTVALDASSRTSAALLKIVLAHHGLRDVAYEERPPSLPGMLLDHDAALLIGDPALTADTSDLKIHDLAEEWFAITRLPFVFAVWTVRPGAVMPEGLQPFLDSRREGLAGIASIAAEMAPRLGLPPATIEEYLRVNIHYHLGTEEIKALDLFFRQAHELGLVPARRSIRFHHPAGGVTAEDISADEEIAWKNR